MSTNRSALVDPAWVAAQMPSVSIFDASWYMPSQQRDPNADFLAERIPGSQRFDIDSPGLADDNSDLPHMLPRAENFTTTVTNLGVTADKPVVIYAQKGFVGAARAWWMFRVFGKQDVFLLNGGLEAWKKDGRDLEKGPTTESPNEATVRPFTAQENLDLVRSMHEVLRQVNERKGVIIDARSKGRFDGTAPEPRPGLLSGHMPGAFCQPSDQLTDADGKLKPVEELRTVLRENGINSHTLSNVPLSLTCGSGVTAAIVCVALFELGIDAAVYDGSWSEYGRHHDNPVEKK